MSLFVYFSCFIESEKDLPSLTTMYSKLVYDSLEVTWLYLWLIN